MSVLRIEDKELVMKKLNEKKWFVIGVIAAVAVNIGIHVWMTPVDSMRVVDNVKLGGNYYTVATTYNTNALGVKLDEKETKVLGSLEFDNR